MRWSSINKTRLILLLALLFTALGAGVFRTSSILFMAATLCGAPLVGMIAGRLTSRGLRISRQMPTCGMVGDVIRVRFTVSNASWCPAFLVHARSLCFEAATDVASGSGAGVKPSRYYSLSKLMHRSEIRAAQARLEAALLPLRDIDARGKANERASYPHTISPGEAEQITPVVLPGAHFTGESYWKLVQRGEYFVPGAGAGAFDPIGLFTDFSARSAPQSLIVMPRPLKLHRLELLAGANGAQQPRGSASVADAAEMNGVRPYRPGEGMRRIHWKATARSNVLHVVEWEEETASGVTLLLDVQSSRISGPKGADTLESSILAAASVASYALENGQRVALFWWEKNASGAPRLAHVEGRHRGALATVLSALAIIVPLDHEEASLPNLVREVSHKAVWAEGLFVLGSDRADWAKTWQCNFSSSARRGLAFDSASFEVTGRSEAKASQSAVVPIAAQSLPSGVRRVRRNEALSLVLEQGHGTV